MESQVDGSVVNVVIATFMEWKEQLGCEGAGQRPCGTVQDILGIFTPRSYK